MIPTELTDRETDITALWYQYKADGLTPSVEWAEISCWDYAQGGVPGKIMKVCMTVDSVAWERILVDGPSVALTSPWDLCI